MPAISSGDHLQDHLPKSDSTLFKNQRKFNGLSLVKRVLCIRLIKSQAVMNFDMTELTSGKHVCENVYSGKPHFYIEKTKICRVIPNFLIFDPKHTLWVLVRTASARRF